MTTHDTMPEQATVAPATTEKATFGAGCFWGVEATFRAIPGVIDTAVGYSGGTTQNPTYREVCSDTTGHAEVVQVEYDPAVVSYDQLLDVFWEHHDPTTLNQQGPDYGSQYRSAIFFHSPEQQTAAQASKEARDRSGKHGRPIVTEITPASTFYRAEEYHQQFVARSDQAFCRTP
jgi:peptide-methionine (S)-S-oxide reductase